MKRKLLFHFSFIFFSSFSVTKSHTSCLHSDLFVCFQILVPHGWFLNVQRADIYACVNACVRLHDCASASARARVYASVVVVVVGMSCEVSCVIFCLVVGYGGMLNALAARADAILCSVVFQPPLPCLALCGDWSHVLTSEFGSSSASPSFSLRGLQVFFCFLSFRFPPGKGREVWS